MRLKTLAITGLLAAAQLCAYAVEPKVSLNSSGKTVGAVLDEIRRSTGYEIFYNDKHVDKTRKVNISASDEEVSKVLSRLFAGTATTFTIRNNQIILNKKGAKENMPVKKKTVSTGSKVVVKGKVTAPDGEPLIGAYVKERGTMNVAVTDLDGNYALSADSDNPVVEVTYVGYEPMVKKVKEGADNALVMKENSQILDDVVVVGYGTMKKRDLTGSVASVKLDDSTAGTVSSVSNALAGKAAGLQVSIANSQPGAASTFRIRGAASPTSNDPLIIIDGFPVNPASGSKTSVGKYDSGSQDNILGSLNPNDIESIEVLKDASSTAIYGSRAGHGVIIVTTKKGKIGKPKVSYSGTVSLQKMAGGYDMLDANAFMRETERYRLEKWRIDNYVGAFGGLDEAAVMQSNPYTPKYSAEMIATPYATTDWFGAVTRTGFQTQHNLSVSGGTEHTRYLVSGNFFLQNGIVKNNDMNRFTLRANIDQKFNKHFSGSLNLTFSRIDTSSIPSGSSSNENAGIMVSAAQSNPMQPIWDENGNFTINEDRAVYPNPVSLLDITNNLRRDRFLGSAYVEYKPIDDLTIKANFGIDRNYHKRKVYLPKTTFYGAKVNGQADIAQYDQNDYLVELTANYNTIFGQDHRFNAVAGWSWQKFNKEGFSAGNSNFLSDALIYNNLAFGQYEKPWVSSSASSDEMMSVFARINYAYAGKYLLTATMRADGSSYFAKGHQWGFFPSVALGWRFSDENFMEDTRSWFSNGKLRLSWGQTGNSNIGYNAISLYRDRDSWGNRFNHGFGGKEYLGFQLTQLANPNITWETTTEWNVGLDLGFINNRINLTLDYFNKEISDLLNWRPLMHNSEVLSIADNIGKTRSQGFELTLNTVNIDNRDFSWSSDFTFSFYRDKWKERADSWSPTHGQTYEMPIRSWYGFYVADGLVQPNEVVPHMPNAIAGQIKVKDVNGYVWNADGTYQTDEHGVPLLTGQPDGKIDDADRVFLGSCDPGYIIGFNNTLRWKNFDFNIYFYGHFDQWTTGTYKDIWLGQIGQLDNGTGMPVSASEIWSTDNPTGWRPGYAQIYNTYDSGSTTLFMKKSFFIRCRNITLGYRIPVKSLSNFRVYLDVNNPFMISNYKGLDMETDDSAYAIPNVRSYNFGVEITF